jgi:hypothetical protein
MKIRYKVWNVLLKHLHYLHLGKVAQKRILYKLGAESTKSVLKYRERELLESFLPKKSTFESSESIAGCVVTDKRELELLELSISGLSESNQETIKEIFVVAPKRDHFVIRQKISTNIVLVPEEDLLPEYLNDYIVKHFPEERRGWIKQQLLKFLSATFLSENGVLLVDADTVILKPQNWLSKFGRQKLDISSEYHDPYQKHFERYLEELEVQGIDLNIRLGVSFVTHHQLMQAWVVREIFGENPHEGLFAWISCIDFTTSMSAASEWHTYGTFLAGVHPEKIQLTQWRNKSVARNETSAEFGARYKELSLDQLRSNFPDLNSISLHHYLK